MRKISLLIILFCWQSTLHAQSVLWSKVFDIHSINSLGGLSQNTIRDIDNNLIVAVVESDILKLYKLDNQGNILASLNTNMECGYFTQIVKANSNDFVVVYDNSPDEINSTLKLIHFNNSLEITQEIAINFPVSTLFSFSSFFVRNNVFYFTGFTNSSYSIYYLDANNDLILIHISSIANANNEKISFLQNSNFLLDFRSGHNHQLRCISPITGQLVWDKYFLNEDMNTIQLEYKTIVDGNDNIYFAGLERTWISGQQNDVIKLRKLDKNFGDVILNNTLIPLNGCLQNIDDFKFNPINGHFYISYRSCFPNPTVTLVELDNNFNSVNQVSFPYVDDSLEAGAGSSILVRNNGNLLFLYTKYKSIVENGNLFIVNLNANLANSGGTVELNIAPKNSSEVYSNLLFYDNSKIIITGLLPNTDQAVWLEEVQHYVAMVDVDSSLSIRNDSEIQIISILPNPVQNTLVINTHKEMKNIIIIDVLGKKVVPKSISFKTIDVSNLVKGIYIIKIITEDDKIFSSKFIKE